jgi:predicted ATPase/class 3 adenylate cyclase
MRELPTGTVSLLFSDIEGSTLLLSRLGQAYVDALDGQRQVLRRAWADHGGTELGTEGDSFFVVFRTAEDAVAAATQAQRQLAAFVWPGNESVRVRMGLHTGTPTVHDGGYVGMDVHRAARIAAAAHGGQVALSAATAGLVDGCLPDGVRLRDLGSHQLKDIPSPERVFDLAIEGLETAFPRLKSLGAAASLPRPGTPLVGRDGELAEVSLLLSSPEVRLVTLTGPGGSGKTRLAIGVAQRLVERFPDGVYFVPLAAVDAPEVMWSTIAEVLAVPPEQRAPPGLFEYVEHRSALFVLDNLEQIDGADDVVADLLEAAQRVIVIATSRRPLHIPDEYEHAVPPLELPDEQSLDAVTSAGAVQLFVQHARKVNAGFSLTASNAADVAAVCRRLDGLPLAIELAAVRCKLLSPAALLSRLDAALDMAAAGRQGPSRQKTLRDTIGWSYDLLTPIQQEFFRNLGVFAGGADLDAIAAVTADILEGADPFDLVAELVDSSLATITEGTGGEPRVGMLETVRGYALDQLDASGELVAVRQRHAEHYLKVAEHLAESHDELYVQARARFEMEHDNFRAVLGHALEPKLEAGSDETGGRLAVRLGAALADFWGAGGYYAEMRRWLEAAVDYEGGRDSPELAQCLTELAFHGISTGHVARGVEYGSASVEMWRRLDDQSGLPRALGVLGELEVERGHFDGARRLYEEFLTLARASGDSRQLLGALGDLATLELSEHRYDRSLELLRQAVAIATELGDPVKRVIVQHNLACILHRMGQFEKAGTQMLDQVAPILRLNEPWMLVVFAEDYAATLAELGANHDAVRLLGAADALRDRVGLERPPSQQVYIADPIAKTRNALNPEEWSASYEAGRGMTIERALPESPGADSM